MYLYELLDYTYVDGLTPESDFGDKVTCCKFWYSESLTVYLVQIEWDMYLFQKSLLHTVEASVHTLQTLKDVANMSINCDYYYLPLQHLIMVV